MIGRWEPQLSGAGLPSRSVTSAHDLQRFIAAQDDAGTYDRALAELRAGHKRTHWMWFVFPQIAGLGSSPTARHYAIASADEARAYAAHPVLGPRLVECARALCDLGGGDPVAVLGPIDALKLRSSMTLFAAVVPEQTAFDEVLERYYDAERDPETLRRL